MFDKHYPHRKDWRKPYRRSQAFDRSCRPHGSCAWCRGDRLHAYKRKVWEAVEAIKRRHEDIA